MSKKAGLQKKNKRKRWMKKIKAGEMQSGRRVKEERHI